MSAKSAKFQESFVSLMSIKRMVVDLNRDEEVALEATSLFLGTTVGRKLTAAKTRLRITFEGPANRSIF